MEQVPLVIGRQSSGEEFIVALEVLPHYSFHTVMMSSYKTFLFSLLAILFIVK